MPTRDTTVVVRVQGTAAVKCAEEPAAARRGDAATTGRGGSQSWGCQRGDAAQQGSSGQGCKGAMGTWPWQDVREGHSRGKACGDEAMVRCR